MANDGPTPSAKAYPTCGGSADSVVIGIVAVAERLIRGGPGELGEPGLAAAVCGVDRQR
jgi:hypothetical protein